MTGRANRLPVVDDGGRMVGIMSRGDVLGVFDRPDNDIRDEVTKKIIVGGFRPRPGRIRCDSQVRHCHDHRAGREPPSRFA
jgi:hypothetical protein